MKPTRIVMVLTTLLAACGEPAPEEPFQDLLLGIELGDDSMEVAEAARENDWHQAATDHGALVFVDSARTHGALAVTFDSAGVSFIDRQWVFAHGDSSRAKHLQDSLSRVLTARYPRVVTGDLHYWVLDASPDSSIITSGMTISTSPDDPNRVELVVVGASKLAELR
jgi:hypothetical protein